MEFRALTIEDMDAIVGLIDFGCSWSIKNLLCKVVWLEIGRNETIGGQRQK